MKQLLNQVSNDLLIFVFAPWYSFHKLVNVTKICIIQCNWLIANDSIMWIKILKVDINCQTCCVLVIDVISFTEQFLIIISFRLKAPKVGMFFTCKKLLIALTNRRALLEINWMCIVKITINQAVTISLWI